MDTLLAGLSPAPSALLDERGRPDFRDVYGALLAESTDVCTALRRVRLSAVDLTGSEVGRVRRFRVLVAEVNAVQINVEARALESQAGRVAHLRLIVLIDCLASRSFQLPHQSA